MPTLVNALARPTNPSALRKGIGALAVIAAASVTTRVIIAGHDEADHWVVVAQDSNASISLDTSRIVAENGRTYEIWYRTDHAVTRLYKDKPFNREVVHAVLRCDDYAFRVMSTAMSVGARSPFVTQFTDSGDLARQPWRRVEPGSIEADAAHATCEVADWANWAARRSP